MLGYRVPAPDQAMLISGGRGAAGAPFKVIVGRGTFVVPMFRKVKFLGLDLKQARIEEPCTTSQGLAVNVKAVIAFKVASDEASIIAAGQRFLNDQREDRTGFDRMTELSGQIFAGHLRAIVGAMKLEDIITQRQALAEQVLDASKEEMARLGLLVDSFQLTHVDDGGSGYIAAMAAPHNAAIQRQAKIAEAQAQQAAAEAEQESQRKQAEYVRETQMVKAQYKADTDKAEAVAAQAGPLAQAESQRQVLAMQSELAQRNAELRQQQLVAEVQRPAEAEAKRVEVMAQAQAARDVTLAEAAAKQTKLEAQANAEATRANGMADAEKIKAIGLAQAEGERAKADAMAANDRAQLDLARINIMPEVARALASSLANANITMLNGAGDMTNLLASVMQQGRMIFDAFKDSEAGHHHTNGESGLVPDDLKGIEQKI